MGDVKSELGLVKGLGDSNTMPGVRMVMVPFTDISLCGTASSVVYCIITCIMVKLLL